MMELGPVYGRGYSMRMGVDVQAQVGVTDFGFVFHALLSSVSKSPELSFPSPQTR
jgi:hypothetical protein